MSILDKITPGPWGISERKQNSTDGYFSVLQQKYIDSPILNPETIESKFFWFTIESGYSYNHPLHRAKANAIAVAAVPEMLRIIERLSKLELAQADPANQLRVEAVNLLNKLNQ